MEGEISPSLIKLSLMMNNFVFSQDPLLYSTTVPQYQPTDMDIKKQLDTVIIEIAGLNEIFIGPVFLQALSKLEGLRVQETNFELYRKTVFEGISLL